MAELSSSIRSVTKSALLTDVVFAHHELEVKKCSPTGDVNMSSRTGVD